MSEASRGLRPLILSAPFGNYLSYPWATSTVGTYTLHRRAGMLKRWWRVLTTLRPLRRVGGWVNRLGLPNPGIDALSGTTLEGRILSVHGFSPGEWTQLGACAAWLRPEALEANLSCPNVAPAAVRALVDGCLRLLNWGLPVIAKLPPVRSLDFARPLYEGGVRHFHCCNTLPTPGGGLSGKPLKPLSLWAVAEVRQAFGEGVEIIGGGGIACVQDVWDYRRAGADRVAVGSALLNVFRGRGWLQEVAAEAEGERRHVGTAGPDAEQAFAALRAAAGGKLDGLDVEAHRRAVWGEAGAEVPGSGTRRAAGFGRVEGGAWTEHPPGTVKRPLSGGGAVGVLARASAGHGPGALGSETAGRAGRAMRGRKGEGRAVPDKWDAFFADRSEDMPDGTPLQGWFRCPACGSMEAGPGVGPESRCYFCGGLLRQAVIEDVDPGPEGQ